MQPTEINQLIKDTGVDTNFVSDGYHTFGELYAHRIVLYLALCRVLEDRQIANVWRSKAHSDGNVWPGWFLLGIYYTAGEQITYHLPDTYWEQTSFATTLEKAPQFDGHRAEDVLNRLTNLHHHY